MRSSSLYSILPIALVLSSGASQTSSVQAAERSDNPAPPEVRTISQPQGAAAAAYTIGPADLVDVTVYGVPELSIQTRVEADGKIQLPIIGAIVAAGKTQMALEREVAAILADGFLVNPQVTVQIKEYRAHGILILGQVLNPGLYHLDEPTSIIEAIAMAGGLTPGAADEVILQRDAKHSAGREGDGSKRELIKVDITGVLQKGETDRNLAVAGGDVIQVPERQRQVFYVVGAVNAPGSYELPRYNRDKPFLLSQALSQAGGPSKVAKMKKGRILRFHAGGPRQDLEIDFKEVFHGKAEDIAIRPDDVLFIPSSGLKDIGYAMVGVVPGTVSAAAISALR